MLEEDARSVAIGLPSPQLTAFASAPILGSSAAVNFIASFGRSFQGDVACCSSWLFAPRLPSRIFHPECRALLETASARLPEWIATRASDPLASAPGRLRFRISAIPPQ